MAAALPAYSTRLIICCILLFIYCLCVTPLMIHGLIKFYRQRNDMFIHKRRPRFTLCHTIICLYGVALYCPIYLLHTSQLNASLTSICFIIDLIQYPVVAYSFLYFLCCKYYLLNFYINWLTFSHKQAWQHHINAAQIDNNFFLRNKNRLGSMSTALKVMSICIMLSIALYFVTYLIEGGFTFIYSITQLIAYIIPAVFLSVLWNKTPSFYDHFLIYHESRIVIISGAIYAVLYLFVAVSPFLGASDYTRALLGDIFGAAIASFMGCYQVWYPTFRVKLIRTGLRRELSLAKYISNSNHALNATPVAVRSQSRTPATPISRSGTSEFSTFDLEHTYHPTNIDLILMHVMDEPLKLDAFFDHIIKEFSIELGLAYIEFAQFKHETSQRLFEPDEQRTLKMSKKIMCVLNNAEIPKSHIVYGDIDELTEQNERGVDDEKSLNEIEACKKRASLLCTKYIRSSAELEINIGDAERQRLTWLLSVKENWENPDRQEVFGLFDSVLKELWALMTNSCFRFIETDEYTKLNQAA